jgi:hypothetical protein
MQAGRSFATDTELSLRANNGSSDGQHVARVELREMLGYPRRGRRLVPLGEELRVRQGVQARHRSVEASGELVHLGPVRKDLFDFVCVGRLPPDVDQVQFAGREIGLLAQAHA